MVKELLAGKMWEGVDLNEDDEEMRFTIDVNETNYDRQTALIKACEYDQYEVVEVLLDLRVDVNAQDYSGWTPLGTACVRGHTGVIKLLLGSPRLIDVNLGNPLWGACKRRMSEVVELLLAAAAINVNLVENSENRESTPLYEACKGKHSAVVTLLLEDPRTDVNYPRDSPR